MLTQRDHQLSPPLERRLATLLERLVDVRGVHLVGGAVRDELRRTPPLDLDLVVEDALEPVLAALGGPAQVHERFGTATVHLGDGTIVDLVRARREVYAAPGALPTVSPGTLEDDLRRRDFTVNAIALALTGPHAGRLSAVPGAFEDLESGVLRVLHETSFTDDPTRLLRLARYAARLGFRPEPVTRKLAEAAVRDGALETVSRERVEQELRLAAREPDPGAVFAALADLGVGSAGALAPAFDLLPPDGRPEVLALSGPTPALEALSAQLAAASAPSQIGALLAGRSLEEVALLGALGAQEPARRWLEHLRHVSLEIDGDDLRAAGLEEGPAVGAGLKAALAERLDGAIAGRDAELRVALAAAREHRD